MFIYTPKVNYIIYFLLEILHLAGSIWPMNFARCQIGGEILITILVYILDCFQENLMTILFKTITWFGAVLDLFCQNLNKNEFSWKKGLSQFFKYSNYLPSCQKSEKKLMSHSWEKCHAKTDVGTDRRTDAQTDWQTDNVDFIEPS